ncbi:MAG: hypothetical protein AL399_00935 [Candidatus [Bacteroides] periocalifornicus]|uniref:Uncharacterized protein n=1 Tax=Candidatus [Bacteroides] periocalifornicus TaxID=1702214 RepID=A0A0Q4BA04_9BACT|nr:MAG: hypothetical protein AL399_00935 [Candidatus [Bacteroides] periocalifornicus]
MSVFIINQKLFGSIPNRLLLLPPPPLSAPPLLTCEADTRDALAQYAKAEGVVLRPLLSANATLKLLCNATRLWRTNSKL